MREKSVSLPVSPVYLLTTLWRDAKSGMDEVVEDGKQLE
jgi:hypothetical protein